MPGRKTAGAAKSAAKPRRPKPAGDDRLARWRELAAAQSRGKSPDDLVWQSPEGIAVQPLYSAADMAGPGARPGQHAGHGAFCARAARHHVRRAALDHPPVRRVLHR